MEQKLKKLQGTLDTMEQKHKKNMADIETQQKLEKDFWDQVDSDRFDPGALDRLLDNNAEINWIRQGYHPLDVAIDQNREELALYCKEKGGTFTQVSQNLF